MLEPTLPGKIFDKEEPCACALPLYFGPGEGGVDNLPDPFIGSIIWSHT